MRKSSFWFLPLVLLLALCVMTGGCGGSSSSRSAKNRDLFIDAVGDIADDLTAIANSAVSNRKVVNAIDDIVGQYIVVSSTDITLFNKALFKSLISGFVKSEDISARSNYKQGLYCEVWSNKHIEVSHDIAEITQNHTTDFQLTVTSTDNHVTRLTVTPSSSTSYWQGFSGASTFLNSLFAGTASKDEALLFVKSYASVEVKVEHKAASESSFTTLLDGTINLTYTGKSNGDEVYMNTPHTSVFNVTVYPQDNKDYTIGIDLTRTTASNGTNGLSNSSDFKMYRKSSTGTKSTLLNLKAAIDATMSDTSSINARPTAMTLTELDVNIANKIRIAESDALDLVKLMGLYVTGTSATKSEVENRVASINELLSKAGLSLYLNNRTTKAGDIRALVRKIGDYYHARLGIQFNGADEPELVREIANTEDLDKFAYLLSSVSNKVQLLAQLLQNSGLLSNVTDNTIIKIIFEDLFGTN